MGQSFPCRPGFFLPVRVLSRLFRRLFLEKLLAAFDAGQLQFVGGHADLSARDAFTAFLAPLRKAEWVVYSKRPFGGPVAVLAYLARYTHRVAIANSRLIALRDGAVTFKWKDYRLEGRDHQKTMTLPVAEFIRRFLTSCRAASTAFATTVTPLIASTPWVARRSLDRRSGDAGGLRSALFRAAQANFRDHRPRRPARAYWRDGRNALGSVTPGTIPVSTTFNIADAMKRRPRTALQET
jgi:hypothetical protein